MKKVFIYSMLAMCLLIAGFLSFAEAAKLKWDANNDPSEITGYRVYWRFEKTEYKRINIPDGFKDTEYSLDSITPDLKHYFVVRAYVVEEDGTITESDNSNEVTYTRSDSTPSEPLSITLLDSNDQEITELAPGVFKIKGHPDYEATIKRATGEEPPLSTNKSKTIYHKAGCRYYNPDRGIADPAECPTCRPCKICKPGS